jgi:predicted dehydrogenase
MTNKKILIIGLGSMGKRRIRNLLHLGFSNIYGFDLRKDRREEAEKKYEIRTFDTFENAINDTKFDAFVISLPPILHNQFIESSIELGIPCFVEVNVILEGLEKLENKAKRQQILVAPSSTMNFHPAVKFIKDTIKSKKLGEISNIMYHSGQYLPDWHPYEKVSDFYVSNPITGGAREIVPFELTWLCSIFGMPLKVAGMFKKTISIDGAELIDDTYNCMFDFDGYFLTMTIDVVSRKARRLLVINGDSGQLIWDWNQKKVVIHKNETLTEEFNFEVMESHAGYNKNITEEMYIKEMEAFIYAAFENEIYPNSLTEDIKILQLLNALETSYKTNSFVNLS